MGRALGRLCVRRIEIEKSQEVDAVHPARQVGLAHGQW